MTIRAIKKSNNPKPKGTLIKPENYTNNNPAKAENANVVIQNNNQQPQKTVNNQKPQAQKETAKSNINEDNTKAPGKKHLNLQEHNNSSKLDKNKQTELASRPEAHGKVGRSSAPRAGYSGK